MYCNSQSRGAFPSAIHRPLDRASADRRNSKVRRRSARIGVIEILKERVVTATIWVTSLLDAGAGTLRAAIVRTDRSPNHDMIAFAP